MYSSGGPTPTDWVLTNNAIYGTINCFAVVGNNIFAGTEWGGVLLSTNGGDTWSEVNSGLTNLTVRTLCSDGTNIFAGTWGGGVFRSANSGASWAAVNTGLTNTAVSSLYISGTNLLAGTWGGGVFRSTNNGASWTAINTGLTETHLRALYIMGTDFYAGTINGLFKSENNGTSWTPINTGLTSTTAISIVGIPQTGGEMLFTGTASGGVFMSTSYGTVWTAVNTGLLNLHIPFLSVSSTNLFAATWGDGVFLTINNGSTWMAVNDGLTNLFIRSLAVSGIDLFAGTDDGGIWRRPLSEMIPLAPDIAADPISWNFGSVNIGGFDDKWFLISNTGAVDLNVTATTLTGTNALEFSVQMGGAPFTLAPANSHQMSLRFAPTSPGSKVAELTIASNDPDENPLYISLNGEGIAGPSLSVNPLTLAFGTTTTSQTLQISNAGSGSLTWNIAENPDKPWITAISPTNGTGNATVTVTVDRAFLPGNSDTGTLAVTSNGGNTNVAVLISKQAAEAVEFSAPDTSGSPGSTIDVPISVSDLTGKEILALSLTIETQTNVLTPIGITTTGTILGAWGNVFFNISAGQISVTGAAASPLSGSGTFVFLRYQVNPAATGGQTSPIHFVDVILNEGNPPCATQDGLFTCTVGFDVSGNVLYYQNSKPINNATMTLDGFTTTTGTNGTFSFATIPSANLTLTPEKDGELGTGISAFDASMILRYVVGILNLTPYQLIAADVSGNGSVTAFDASYILRYVVNLISSFPIGDDWQFVPSSFAIDATNWSSAPNSISYAPLNSNQTNQNFKGIIYGDVSGNWAFSGLVKNLTGSATIEFGEEVHLSSTDLSIPIFANVAGDMFSLELTVQFDADLLQFSEIQLNEKLAAFSECHNLNKGILTIALAGTEPVQSAAQLISLRFESKNIECKQSTSLTILNATMNEGQIPVALSNGGLMLRPSLPATHRLEQNYPNPFNPTTTIAYSLAKSAFVTLTIFDVNGKVVKQLIHELKQAGNHQVDWDTRSNLGLAVASGVYFYKIEVLETDGKIQPFIEVKKMILMR